MQQNTNYPTMYGLGFSDRDVARLNALPSNSKAIDRHSIKNFVLGTSINTINSTHLNSPIFNLANLDEEELIKLAKGDSQEYTSITLESNKTALSNSRAWSADMDASLSVMGAFGASANAHYEQAEAFSKSDGKIRLTITKGQSGVYYEILATGLSGEGVNFTPFLKGGVMDDVDPENAEYKIKDYVGFTEKPLAENDDRTYIDTLEIKGHNNSGQIDWSLRRYYENIRLLTEMETIFAALLDQYEAYSDMPIIRDILYGNMLQLKETIGHAIKDFYKNVGDHFVSKLSLMNLICGYGELDFKDRASNHEKAFGAGLSIGGGIPSKLNVSAGGGASYAMKNGWASYSKSMEIHVQAQPSGIEGTHAFAEEIRDMLKGESTSLSVPDLEMPSIPEVTIKEPKETKKPSSSPPDSVFKSYADWKDYQADLKKKSNIDAVQEAADKKVKKDPESIIIEESILMTTTEDSHEVYDRFMDEVGSLGRDTKNMNAAVETASGDSQLFTLDKMFVSGFSATPYEAVIPALRASGIELPDQTNRMNAYPNATVLMVHMDIVTKLVEYVSFISQFSISNIDFQNNLDNFLKLYTKEAQTLISSHMGSGIDIHASVVNHFFKKMYQDDQVKNTALCNALKADEDQIRYFKYLLGKDVYRCWHDAPGGYAPFIFDDEENLCFAEMDLLRCDYPGCKPMDRLYFKQNRQVSEPPDNIAGLYEGLNQSPLFPIFRYESRDTPKLMYLQFVGPYQFIYCRNGVIYPRRPCLNEVHLDQRCFNDTVMDINPEAISRVVDNALGYGPGNTSWALYFPKKTQTNALRKKYRIRLLEYGPCHEGEMIQASSEPYQEITIDGVKQYYGLFFQDNYSFMNKELCKNKGKIVKVSNGNLRQTKGLRMLLPIGYDKIQRGYGSLLMGSAYGFEDIAASKSFEAAAISSLYH